jgi:hypothetical protein
MDFPSAIFAVALFLGFEIPRLATGHALHLLLRAASVWLLLSVTFLLLASAASLCYSALLRLRRSLAGSELQPFDERRHGQRRFDLRLTRRDLPPAQGAALESLQHAIDYLVERHDLRRFAGPHDGDPPPQLTAVELLLQCRAGLLAAHPPLPSVLSQLRQRRALRTATERN